MIRSLRKRHRWTFIVLAIVLVVVLLWALGSRPDWPQETADRTIEAVHLDAMHHDAMHLDAMHIAAEILEARI